jgi:metallo-beta-lactamase family protein
MAVQATRLYLKHGEDHDLDMQSLIKESRDPLATHRFLLSKTRDESKRISAASEPSIVISASGMATGGRILHHLRHRLDDERNTVMFVGFQAAGTRGRRLVEGEKELKLFVR